MLVSSVNEIASLVKSVSTWISFGEIIVIGLLFYLALGTRKLDVVLDNKGVDKFGAFLTVASIIYFMISRTVTSNIQEVVFKVDWFNTRFEAFIILGSFFIVFLLGAIYLLFYKYPKES